MLPQCGFDLHFEVPPPPPGNALPVVLESGCGVGQAADSLGSHPQILPKVLRCPSYPGRAVPWPQAQLQEASRLFLGGDKYLLCPLTHPLGLLNENICLTFLMKAD